MFSLRTQEHPVHVYKDQGEARPKYTNIFILMRTRFF